MESRCGRIGHRRRERRKSLDVMNNDFSDEEPLWTIDEGPLDAFGTLESVDLVNTENYDRSPVKLQAEFQKLSVDSLRMAARGRGQEWLFEDTLFDPFDCETGSFFPPQTSRVILASQCDEVNKGVFFCDSQTSVGIPASECKIKDDSVQVSLRLVTKLNHAVSRLSMLKISGDDFFEFCKEATDNLGMKLALVDKGFLSGINLKSDTLVLSNPEALFTEESSPSETDSYRARALVAVAEAQTLRSGSQDIVNCFFQDKKGFGLQKNNRVMLYCALAARNLGSKIGAGVNELILKEVQRRAGAQFIEQELFHDNFDVWKEHLTQVDALTLELSKTTKEAVFKAANNLSSFASQVLGFNGGLAQGLIDESGREVFSPKEERKNSRSSINIEMERPRKTSFGSNFNAS